MKLVWAKEAEVDLDRLFNFLLEKSPNAAAKAMRAIYDNVDKLIEFPEIGPLIDDSGRREYYIPFAASAYVLRYYIVNDHVVIVRVWHGRESRK